MNAYTVSRLALDVGVSMHNVRDYLLRGLACFTFRFLRRPLLALGRIVEAVSAHTLFVVVLTPVQGLFGFALFGLAFLCRRRHLLGADVGIAVGSGTDVAAETADIILVKSDPRDILSLILFGKATYKKMIQNLVWATAYNAVAIPLAAGVLYSFDFLLSPAVGAVIMTLSTVVVAINAQLLKRSLKLLRS